MYSWFPIENILTLPMTHSWDLELLYKSTPWFNKLPHNNPSTLAFLLREDNLRCEKKMCDDHWGGGQGAGAIAPVPQGRGGGAWGGDYSGGWEGPPSGGRFGAGGRRGGQQQMWVSGYSGGYSEGYSGGYNGRYSGDGYIVRYGSGGYGGGGYSGGRGVGRGAGGQAPPPVHGGGGGGYNGGGYAGGQYPGGGYSGGGYVGAHGGYIGGGHAGGGYAGIQCEEGNGGGEYNGIDIGSNNTSELGGNDVKLRFDLSKLNDVPKRAGGVRVGSSQYAKNKLNRIDYSE